jgi:molybdenum cofactor cytidylyltransferase
MGTLKQVMPIKGKPLVRQVAEPLLAAGLDLIIVIGHERDRVQSVLYDLLCQYVVNPHPEDGMFSSVQVGCMAVPPGEACLISTCDCPGIRPETIRRVKDSLEREQEKVIIPIYQGRRGHPAGLPAFLVDHIRTLAPDTPGLNSLWRHKPEIVLELDVDDPAILRDLDRPEDVKRFLT